MENDPVLLALKRVWEALDPFGVPMAIVGGIALAVWQHARFTKDVDILLTAEDEGIEKIVEKLKQEGMRPKRDPPLLGIGEVDLLQMLYEPPDTFLDLQIDLLFARTEFHRQALGRRVAARLPRLDTEVFVLACEDIIVMKLLAGRVIDKADASALLRANRQSMDVDHLSAWIGKLNLDDEFAEIWGEAFAGERPPTRRPKTERDDA
jgi:hypothetical protein